MTEPHSCYPEEEFTGRLRSRMPMNVLFTFTADQLHALRTAFGARFERRHSVDMRGRLYLPWRRYYFVVQFGRDARVDPRRVRRGAGFRMLRDSLCVGLVLAAGVAALGWLVMQAL